LLAGSFGRISRYAFAYSCAAFGGVTMTFDMATV